MRMRETIEAELRRGPLCTGLGPGLREAYRQKMALPRSRELTLLCQYGSILYLLAALLTNLLAPASPVWSQVAAQSIVAPLLALGIAQMAFRPEKSVLLREGGAFAAAAAFSLSTLFAVSTGHGALMVLNFFLVSLTVIAAVFFVHLRFASAAALVGLTAVALWLTLLARADVPPELRGYPLGFLLAISAPALLAVHRLDRASRQAYLMALLHDLRIEQLAQENALLTQLCGTDALTGAANRRELETALHRLCAAPPAGDFLLLADIDFFKRFNDRHGHVAGDACLRAVVAAIRSQVRRADVVARFGGEEFAIILANTSRADAMTTAERIRAGIASQTLAVNGRSESVTVSIGLAERHAAMTPATLMTLADSALYAAKRDGRNRVRSAGDAWREVAA